MDRASRLAWPLTHLGVALELLAHTSGLRPGSGTSLPPPSTIIDANRDATATWIEQACRQLSLEAEPTEIPYNAVEQRLRHAGPALLMLPDANGASFLALVEGGRRAAIVLGRDGRRHRMRMSELASWLREDL